MALSAYALSNNSLILLSTDNPDNPNAAIPIIGLDVGETLVGIDVRPQNGKLYGLASNGTGVRLYVISPQTGVATPLTAAPVQFDDGSGNAVPIQGTNFGFDFNPTVDRIRVVTDAGQNFRMNPNTGTLADGNNGGADTPGINPDGAVSGGTTTVDGTAYTNSSPNATATTQYTLDANTNSLLIQNPPNNGVQTQRLEVKLNGSTLDFTAVNGFDIPADVNVTASNAGAIGRAFAALTVGSTTGLYAIELSTGTATLVGSVGAGTAPVQGFATQNTLAGNGTPMFGLSGTNLIRFNSALPGTVTPVAVTGVPTGETLVGIDFRPATGQLFGFSVNDTTNTGTLLILDPQTGAATPVGTPGQIAFVDQNGNPVDLPATGYGFDFNPTVDRIRVVTSSGLNFRLNPITGTAVDGDNGGAANSVNGVNPDGAIQGATTSADATAYTNSFSQVTGATVTTQYTLDAATNSLLIQNPPNSGTQTSQLGVTLNGSALDFEAVNGFDIPASVRVNASNSPATGRGFAALQVGGSTNLYAIELSTGAATLVGPVGTGATPLSGLTTGEAPAGSVGFEAATYTASEGGSINLNLVRTDGATGALTVNLAATITGGGTATSADFTGAPVVVSFADGQTTATATISITDDEDVEGSEAVTFALTNPTNGAVLSAQDTTTLTIIDNEAIRGTEGNDTRRGTLGNDTLLGLGGNDRLLGRAGDDSLNGGEGRDRLTGSLGADRFVYSGGSKRAAFSQSTLRSPDRIFDFDFDQDDRIQLDFDNKLNTRNRPRRLFSAGEQDGDNLREAVENAFEDKNQRQRGDQALQANEAVFFRLGSRTFLAVNDGQAEFSNERDLLVNVTKIDFRGNDGNRGSLRVANYFA